MYTGAVTLRDIMSSPVITIDSTESASKAVDMMLQHNVKHLLVVDKQNNISAISSISSFYGHINSYCSCFIQIGHCLSRRLYACSLVLHCNGLILQFRQYM